MAPMTAMRWPGLYSRFRRFRTGTAGRVGYANGAGILARDKGGGDSGGEEGSGPLQNPLGGQASAAQKTAGRGECWLTTPRLLSKFSLHRSRRRDLGKKLMGGGSAGSFFSMGRKGGGHRGRETVGWLALGWLLDWTTLDKELAGGGG